MSYRIVLPEQEVRSNAAGCLVECTICRTIPGVGERGVHDEPLLRVGDFRGLPRPINPQGMPYFEQLIANAERDEESVEVVIHPVVYCQLLHSPLLNFLTRDAEIGLSEDVWVVTLNGGDVVIEHIRRGTTTRRPQPSQLVQTLRQLVWLEVNPFPSFLPNSPWIPLGRSIVRSYLEARWLGRPLPADFAWRPDSERYGIHKPEGNSDLVEIYPRPEEFVPSELRFTTSSRDSEVLPVAPGDVEPNVLLRAIEFVLASEGMGQGVRYYTLDSCLSGD